jgi:glycosyltransferase involved in cell wall biosynthesis
MKAHALIVVPCYNEALRLEPASLSELADIAECDVLAIDDGSTDQTASLLVAAAAADHRVHTLVLDRNRGKGEAVRRGLQWADAEQYAIAGFCDADFATPMAEMRRLLQLCTDGSDVVLGSRVAILGHAIERSPIRHYTGRVFATMACIVLGFQVYDTQCGAKVFRVGPALRAAVKEKFASRWAFDVELIGRLAQEHGGTNGFSEEPLRAWRDVAASKLSLADSLRAIVDLWRIRRSLATRAKVRSGVTSSG